MIEVMTKYRLLPLVLLLAVSLWCLRSVTADGLPPALEAEPLDDEPVSTVRSGGGEPQAPPGGSEESEVAAAGAAPSDEDVAGLVAVMQEKLRLLKQRQNETEVPISGLVKELERARADVEQMAEVIVRKELVDLRRQAEIAKAEEHAETLSSSLGEAEEQLGQVLSERNRLQNVLGESTERINNLARSLSVVAEERTRLQSEVMDSREEAAVVKADLEKAEQRMQKLNAEIDTIVARNEEAIRSYEDEMLQMRDRMGSLQQTLTAEKQRYEDERRALSERYDSELKRRQARVEALRAKQVEVKSVLERALAEIDEVAAKSELSGYEQEMLQKAAASSEARKSIVGSLGIGDDKRQVLADLIAADDSEAVLAALEPEAGPRELCGDTGDGVERPYLSEQSGEQWRHHLVGRLEFGLAEDGLQKEALDPVIACLKSLERIPTVYFKIVGHTDALGPAERNEELSLQRARVVRERLMEHVNVQPWRVLTFGEGEAYPIADNESEDGRGRNRRVEVFAVQIAL